MTLWRWLRYVFSDFMPLWLWCTFAAVVALLIAVYTMRYP